VLTKSAPFYPALAASLIALVAFADPAFAHHVMGGRQATTFGEGLLSGLGHPVIGLDHFAAVVAIGCLAAAHRAGSMLVVGYVVAMMLGVALHLTGATVPASELLVALTVLALGFVLLLDRGMSAAAALTAFALVGLIHGYALGESIYGAERTPLVAYLIGLAVIQSAISLGAMLIARAVIRRADVVTLRLVGAGIAGIGLAIIVGQIFPAPPGS
jgi:urease accessory protein